MPKTGVFGMEPFEEFAPCLREVLSSNGIMLGVHDGKLPQLELN